jgi:hypothetical protein
MCPRHEHPKTIQIQNTVPWKIWVGNSIYDMKWGTHTLDTNSPFCFYFWTSSFLISMLATYLFTAGPIAPIYTERHADKNM